MVPGLVAPTARGKNSALRALHAEAPGFHLLDPKLRFDAV